jgi:hypothetical protein
MGIERLRNFEYLTREQLSSKRIDKVNQRNFFYVMGGITILVSGTFSYLSATSTAGEELFTNLAMTAYFFYQSLNNVRGASENTGFIGAIDGRLKNLEEIAKGK